MSDIEQTQSDPEVDFYFYYNRFFNTMASNMTRTLLQRWPAPLRDIITKEDLAGSLTLVISMESLDNKNKEKNQRPHFKCKKQKFHFATYPCVVRQSIEEVQTVAFSELLITLLSTKFTKISTLSSKLISRITFVVISCSVSVRITIRIVSLITETL